MPVVAATLSLYTFHAPPFQIEPVSGGSPTTVTGTTVDTIECVTGRMGWDTRIRTVPQNRAIHGLSNHSVDGYFAVRESSKLEPFAQATAPVALEKWYVYSRGPIVDFRRARIGVVAGSNEALWLEQNKFSPHMQVSSTPQLLAVLDRGRVDAVLLDRRVMRSYLEELPNEERQRLELESRFVRFAPLHLYLNRGFLAINQPFLAAFNHHLPGCIKTEFQLDEQEADIVRALARKLLDDAIASNQLTRHLINHVPYSGLDEVLALDQAWQDHAPARHSPLAIELLQNPTSRSLARWQDSQQKLVTEIFVMDAMGAITALSQLTSDFWQGDERKFQATVAMGSGDIHLSAVHFDHSSRRFQVIASAPVWLLGGSRFVGAVAVGLDVELALALTSEVFLPLTPRNTAALPPAAE
ncbi:MAG: transporter substrate-binding domain-containing protein [Marinobacter sp.]|uniref:substrate-binding periplasmic protein n=1 Tax=Marinobacter sp. TaxID=50741 RepID=UPI00299F51E9|nr:transporter substrate-binding domain-containing protein [Marinobacter sp.]MDX1634195.1 transporter substrate-binding domain-containing protein [Marinobacter sp.]